MNILNPTYTIYKSRKFEFIWEGDYRKAVATDDIYAGDLLLLEHALYDDIKTNDNIIVSNLLYNENLWNEMYPRELDYNLDDVINNNNTDAIIDATTAKINKNVFRHDEVAGAYYALLRDGQIFNHLKEPNCNYHHISVPTRDDLPQIKIYYFIAYKDIKKGDEICTNYGNEYFNEDTDLSDYNNKQSDIFIKNKSKILSKIDKYLESRECRDVFTNHHFYKHGLVFIQNQNRYIALPSFTKLLKGDEKEDIKISELNDWVNTQLLKLISFLKTKNIILNK
jgi:SET domain-containing protein